MALLLKRLDASHWALIVLGLVSAGSLGCFGMAAVAQSQHGGDADILMTDNFPPPVDVETSVAQ